MAEVVRLDAPPPPLPAPRRRWGVFALGLVVVLTVVAIGLLDAQSQHREQRRQQDATAFSVGVQLDSYRSRASGLRLTLTLRNDGPLPVLVGGMTVGGLRGDDAVKLEPDAVVAVELEGTVDCSRPVPTTAQVVVSMPDGDRTIDAPLPADLDALCVVPGEALRAWAGSPEPVVDGLSVPLTVENTGLPRLRLLAVRVRGTTARLSSDRQTGPPDPARFIVLPAGSSQHLELRIVTPATCSDLAQFLDGPGVVLRYDSGTGTLVASLRVPIDRSVLPDVHDVCG